MTTTHIWPSVARPVGDSIEVSARIEVDRDNQFDLWYRIPHACHDLLPDNADHFVTGAVFGLMQAGSPVHVHGRVSPSLLRNLAEFQNAWAAMRPGLQVVEISADDERESTTPEGPPESVVAFSGGVDSCFSAYRHARGAGLQHPRPLTAGVMVHGFDIPLADSDAFTLAAAKAGRILSSLGLELIPIATNYREVVTDWNHSHGAAIASCLRLFGRRFSHGLVGQTFTYGEIRNIAEGVNALTDPLLSSDSFQIVPDGAACGRSDKIELMRDWPEFLADVRVCWQGSRKDRNCCVCEKCIRSILTFRALGLGLPPCFDRDVTDGQIARLNPGDVVRAEIRYGGLGDLARRHDAGGRWVEVLERTLRRSRRRREPGIYRTLSRVPYYARRLMARVAPGRR